jgi:secondary thiamine-phosphate synthase enzyme
MAFLEAFEVETNGRSTIDITASVGRIVQASGIRRGIASVFTQHTSCSLIVTENADPDVRRDLETLARRWAPDGDKAYCHDTEGDDDMAAHARSVLTNCSLAIPVDGGELLLGTWQAIFELSSNVVYGREIRRRLFAAECCCPV